MCTDPPPPPPGEPSASAEGPPEQASGPVVRQQSVGRAGAINAALLAAAILANKHPAVKEKLLAFRAKQTAEVMARPDPKE